MKRAYFLSGMLVVILFLCLIAPGPWEGGVRDPDIRFISWMVDDISTAATVGTNKAGVMVPYNSVPASGEDYTLTFQLCGAEARVYTPGTTGTMDIQINRRRMATDADMLSTQLTMNSGDYIANDATVSTTNGTFRSGDLLEPEVSAIHTTASNGLWITLAVKLMTRLK